MAAVVKNNRQNGLRVRTRPRPDVRLQRRGNVPRGAGMPFKKDPLSSPPFPRGGRLAKIEREVGDKFELPEVKLLIC